MQYDLGVAGHLEVPALLPAAPLLPLVVRVVHEQLEQRQEEGQEPEDTCRQVRLGRQG